MAVVAGARGAAGHRDGSRGRLGTGAWQEARHQGEFHEKPARRNSAFRAQGGSSQSSCVRAFGCLRAITRTSTRHMKGIPHKPVRVLGCLQFYKRVLSLIVLNTITQQAPDDDIVGNESRDIRRNFCYYGDCLMRPGAWSYCP